MSAYPITTCVSILYAQLLCPQGHSVNAASGEKVASICATAKRAFLSWFKPLASLGLEA